MLRSFSRSSISYARSVMLVVMTNETSIKVTRLLRSSLLWVSELESSRTDFQVLGLNLEAYKSSKIALSSAKDSTIFWIIKISLENARNLAKNLRRSFFRDRLKKIFDHLFFGEHLRLCPWFLALASSISVLGLERVCPRKGCPCPWPRIVFCPWPRALCSRFHFWWQWLHRKNARIRFITKMRNLHCLFYT